MKIRALCSTILLIFLCGGALGEEMPVVVDEPISHAEDIQTDDLRLAQQRLIDIGLLSGRADGIYGPKTAAALRDFQARNGLAETGKLDAATADALARYAERAASVRQIQQRLIDLGYLRGRADGIFGERSAAALKLFQRVQGLEPTGAIDDATSAALFSDGAAALPEGLASGDKGEDVLRLQKRLIQFGFLSAGADGEYGKKTAAAVRAFQQHLAEQGIAEGYGISASGEATPATLLLLLSGDYSSYLRDLAPGDSGDEALRVERRLAQLGYMDQEPDDAFDDYAASAAALFAEQSGLEYGGVAGKALVDALFAEDAPAAEHCAPHDIAAGDSGLAVSEAERALVLGGMLIKLPSGRYSGDMADAVERLHDYLLDRKDRRAELFADPKALSVEAQQALLDGLLGYAATVGGDKKNADETLRVQRRLHTLYYLSKDGLDGKFGPNSRDAVKAFQAANGLEATGIADEATQRRLFSAQAVAKPYPYRVEVSISRQQVEIYQLEDDGQYRQVQTFTCSTGLHNSTPRGIFLDGFPVNRWHYFEKFNCWAQYSYEIVGDIMFHSVLYSTNSEGSLRTGSVYALGSPASHGCIRLRVADAKWLFEHCKRGTSVIVIY